jgi:hypothetical protein
MGFVVDRVTLEQVISDYFGFRCQSFHRLLHTHHHPSSGAGKMCQIVADSLYIYSDGMILDGMAFVSKLMKSN